MFHNTSKKEILIQWKPTTSEIFILRSFIEPVHREILAWIKTLSPW